MENTLKRIVEEELKTLGENFTPEELEESMTRIAQQTLKAVKAEKRKTTETCPHAPPVCEQCIFRLGWNSCVDEMEKRAEEFLS